MKSAIVRVLFVLVFCTLTKFATAGDFISQVVQTGQTITITVPPDRFLVIRNFTQDGTGMTATMRGSVSVVSNGVTINNAFTASIADPSAVTLEVVNNFVVAGPATVTVNPGNTSCFITYRKGTD
jgi:hypothetical protein